MGVFVESPFSLLSMKRQRPEPARGKGICCSDQMLQSAVMRLEQVTSHLSVTASEREREGGGGSSRD